MNFNNTTRALALSGALFFTLPMSSVFANQASCEASANQPYHVLKQVKTELRGYVQAVKSDDQTSMQTHVNALLTLSEKANQSMTGMDHSNMQSMDHSNMKGMDHSNMKEMDHSKMSHEEHQQHMAYMSGMPQLQQQFEALNQTTDKTEIKAILLEVKGSLETIGPQSSLHCS